MTRLTPTPEPVVIDLDKSFFEQLSKAAAESNWIPQEHYYANDWVSDCCEFLRTGKGVTPEPSLREALVEARDFLRDVSGAEFRSVAEAKTLLDKIASALSASPAEPEEATEAICEHDWHYLGTDRGGSHKGEDAYKCHKCGKYEYQP